MNHFFPKFQIILVFGPVYSDSFAFQMFKGRLWRYLLFFLAVYLICLLYFFRSFTADTEETTTTSPLPHAKARVIDLNAEEKKDPEPVIRAQPDNNPTNLAPVMTRGVLGNYEPKQLDQINSPGEGGVGILLTGDEEKKKGDDSVAAYGFNEVASDKISLDRHARDTR